MSQIQMDNRNGFAPTLVKELLRIKTDSYTQDAQNLLRRWDFTQPTGRSDQAAAAAYYNAVWSKLLDLTFNDELTGDIKADGGGRWMQAVANLLQKKNDPWWDNKQTPGVIEGRDEILRQAMVEARNDLTKRLGKNAGGLGVGQPAPADAAAQGARRRGRAGTGPRPVQPRARGTCPAARPSSTPTGTTRARASR